MFMSTPTTTLYIHGCSHIDGWCLGSEVKNNVCVNFSTILVSSHVALVLWWVSVSSVLPYRRAFNGHNKLVCFTISHQHLKWGSEGNLWHPRLFIVTLFSQLLHSVILTEKDLDVTRRPFENIMCTLFGFSHLSLMLLSQSERMSTWHKKVVSYSAGSWVMSSTEDTLISWPY